MAVITHPTVPDRREAFPDPSPQRWPAPEARPPLRVLMIAWDLPSASAAGIGVPGERLVDGLREGGAEIVLLVGGRTAPRAETLRAPSWNGTRLDEVYPWGTIRTPTPEANRTTAELLSPAERSEVRTRAGHYLDAFDYQRFLT